MSTSTSQTEILPLLFDKLSLQSTQDISDHSYGKSILTYLSELRPSVAQSIKDDSSIHAYMHAHPTDSWIHLWHRVDKLSCILSTPWLHPRLCQFYLNELVSTARFLTLQHVHDPRQQEAHLLKIKALTDWEIHQVPQQIAHERSEWLQLHMLAFVLTMDRDRLCALKQYMEAMEPDKDHMQILSYLIIAEMYARNVPASRYFAHYLYGLNQAHDDISLSNTLKHFCALLTTSMEGVDTVMQYQLQEDEHWVLSNELVVDLSADPNATQGLSAKVALTRTFSGMYPFFNRILGCKKLLGEHVIMEEMQQHTFLKDFVRQHQNTSFADRRDMILMIANALNFMHQLDMPFTHLDIESISLDSDLMPLLSLTNEFFRVGDSFSMDSDSHASLDAVDRRKKEDVYAFGVVAWQILTSCSFFEGPDAASHINLSGMPGWLKGGEDMASLYLHIFNLCWNEQLDERPSMHQVIDMLVDANSRSNGLYDADSDAWKQVMESVSKDDTEPLNMELKERVAMYAVHYPETQIFKADAVADAIYNCAILAYDTKDYPQAFQYFAKSAAFGHAGGDNGLGLCFYYGYSVKDQQRFAFSYFLKASERNWPGAVRNVGISYESGEGVPLSYEKAFEYYQKGSHLKHAESIANLAACYYYGRGTSSFWRKAIAYFEQASELGSAYGTRMLATCYQEGNGVTVDDVKAMLLFEKAVDLGDKFSVSLLCELLFKHHAYKKIEQMCTHLSSRGNHDATVYLGHLKTKTGEWKEAQVLYKQAALQGNNGDAWYFYGYMQERLGTDASRAIAKSCYTKALECFFTYFENDAHFSQPMHQAVQDEAHHPRHQRPLFFEKEALRAFYDGSKSSYSTLLFLWESAIQMDDKWTCSCCQDKYPSRFNPVHAIKRLYSSESLQSIYHTHIASMQRAIERIFNSPEYHGIRSSTTTDAYKQYPEASHVVVTISFHLFRALLMHFISDETALSPTSLILFNAHLEQSSVTIPPETLTDVILDMTFDAHVPFSALFLEACIDYLVRYEADDKLAGLYIKFIHEMQSFKERTSTLFDSLTTFGQYASC